jgi:hypothetical protein
METASFGGDAVSVFEVCEALVAVFAVAVDDVAGGDVREGVPVGAGRHAVTGRCRRVAVARGLAGELIVTAWSRVLLCALGQPVVAVLAGRAAAAGPKGEARRGRRGRRQRHGRRRREAPPLRT